MSVVNLKGRKPQCINAGEVYCGRPQNMGGWRLPGSKFANPFKIGRDGTLDEVLEKYREYVMSTPTLMDSLEELRNKVLACWCAPAKCHCDVLLELIEMPKDQEVEPAAAEEPTADSEPAEEDPEDLVDQDPDVDDEENPLEFQIDLEDDDEEEQVEFFIGDDRA